MLQSDQFFLSHDFFKGGVALAGSSDVAAQSDVVGLGEVDGAVVVEVADGQLHWGVVLGGDDAVGVVALAWQEDVGDFALVVDGALHSGLEVSVSACFHWLQIF